MAVVGSTDCFLVVGVVAFFLVPLLSTTSLRLLSCGTLKISGGDGFRSKDWLGEWPRLLNDSFLL